MNQKAAISKIIKRGVLLVFPLNNEKEPASLWSEFHPRKKMKWVWDVTSGVEVDDGAFPSLAVGSTRTLFENLVLASHKLKAKDAETILEAYMPEGTALRKFYEREVRR